MTGPTGRVPWSGCGRSVPVEPRVAVDTSVVVNFLTGGRNDDPGWLEHSTWVFAAAEKEVHRLVVPALVLAEVAGDPQTRGSQLPSGERRRRIGKVKDWLARGRFLVADVDERVARLAAELAVDHQLKGADACITAAAMINRCTTLYSWDAHHLKLDGRLDGMTVVQPRARPLEQSLFDLS